MNGGEAAPRGSQVQPASNELRVGPLPCFPALCDHGRVGDPNGQCLPAPLATLTVEQGPLGDTEQPRPRIRGIGWQVVEATSGHQECVGHDVLGVARVDATPHESDEVRIRHLVHRAEPRLSIRPRACVSAAHTDTCPSCMPVCLDSAILFPKTRIRLRHLLHAIGRSLIGRPETQNLPTACRST